MARFPFYLFVAIVLVVIASQLFGDDDADAAGPRGDRFDTWTGGRGVVIEGHRVLVAEVVGDAFITDDLSGLGSFLALDVELSKQPELFEPTPR